MFLSNIYSLMEENGIMLLNEKDIKESDKNMNENEFVEADINGRFSVRMDKNSENFVKCLENCIRYGIENYVPKAAAFACCARYKECLEKKRCIHPNTLYAKACEYRKNLENGRVFY